VHAAPKPQERTIVVLGASPKPVRYSYQAVRLLADQGFRVIPVHPKAERIDHIPVVHDLSSITGPVDTLTLYIGPDRVHPHVQSIVRLRPRRVILNPGAESHELEVALANARIPCERACTLVLLRTGQF
jgi:predicted CoA-binding protein